MTLYIIAGIVIVGILIGLSVWLIERNVNKMFREN